MRGSVRTNGPGEGVQSAEYVGARDDYLVSHIPGAVYIDWTTDIADISDPIPAQIADEARISALFGRLGIGDTTQIVAYDSHPSMQFATRLWWVCKYFGNDNVRVLSGGWARWLTEGWPVSDKLPNPALRTFTASPRSEWKASAREVLKAIGDPNIRIVDARDAEQFTGRIRRGKRGGHIPGATHLPRESIFVGPGQLMVPAALRDVFHAAGIIDAQEVQPADAPRVIAYCNGGVAATSVLFALSILGYSRLTNYDGSWNEWNLDDSLPVESC